MNDHVNTKEAREMLRITATTLRTWDKLGKIKTTRTPTGIRLYSRKSIQEILTKNGMDDKKKDKYAYCRVSCKKQKDDLGRQVKFYTDNYPGYKVIQDIGSGINFKRHGLQTILEQSMQGKISEVLVSHRDRLCRFAFELIEWILNKNNVKLVVLDKETHISNDQELAEDVLAIIHVYSCRQMGKRRYTGTENKTETNKTSKKDTDELE